MASAYSQPTEFDNYVQPVNLELVNFVLQSKEQKFNYNLAKVEQTLSEFGNLGLTRDQDKQYLADRLNTVISQMGDLEKLDWSDTNVERQITAGIRSAIDGRVRQAVTLSRGLQNYQQTVQNIREKNPDQYSDINAQMPLVYAGVDKWLAGETDSFNLNALQYTPPVDYRAVTNENIQDYIKTHGTTRVERIPTVIDGVFTVIEREVLDRETVESIWENSMTPEMIRQMQMEADYMYRNASPQDQERLMQQYSDKLSNQKNSAKTELALLQEKFNSSSGTEKETYQELIQTKENEIKKLNTLQQEPTNWAKVYTKHHFDNVKEGIINTNSFNRITDIETDYGEVTAFAALRNLELREQGLDLQRQRFAAEQQERASSASGNDISIVPNPTIVEDREALGVYELTEKSIADAVEKFPQAMLNNPKFDDIYGGDNGLKMTREEFAALPTEDQQKLAMERMEKIYKEGIDLSASDKNVYTDEEIKLAGLYTSNKAARDFVKGEIAQVSEDVSKNVFENMQRQYRSGNNALIEQSTSPVAQAIRSGQNYNQLNPDVKKAVRIEMIDEALRNKLDDESIRPYLIAQREELLESIEKDEVRNQFVETENLTRTNTGLLLETLRNANIDMANSALGRKLIRMSTRVIPTPILDRVTEGLEPNEGAQQEYMQRQAGDRNTSLLYQNSEIDGVSISEYIKNNYDGAAQRANQAATEIAPMIPSTSAAILNPNIKSQKELHQFALDRIVANNPDRSVQDFQNSEVSVTHDPTTDTFTFTAKLDRQSVSAYEAINDRLERSVSIPRNKLGNMAPLINRIDSNQDAWAFDSRNPYSQGLTFRSRGFENSQKRIEAINNIIQKMPNDNLALEAMQQPQRLAYTLTEMERTMQNTKRVEDNQTRVFTNEYPNAYEMLSNGVGEFVVDFKSMPNRGYFYDVHYRTKNANIPIITPRPLGQTKLDPDRAYLEAFKIQKQAFDSLVRGYYDNDSDILNKLTEIDKLNGRN